MDKYKSILVNPQTTISKTLEIIDHSALQIALVVDEASRLVGTVTDGDVRRGLLKGVSLQEPIEAIMNRSPTVCSSDQSRKEILAQMKSLKLRHIPIVDSQRRVVALEILEQLIESLKRDNWVVLMAGGLGQRLRPLTNDIPKPLLQVGNKPLLETTLEGFIEQGFRQFYISVNYKAKMIEEYFGNGSKWGIEIKYLHEEQRLGTAGGLGLLTENPTDPIIVMNCDLLTKVNFQQLLEFHLEHRAEATMCVREYDFQVPYGVVQIEKENLIGIDEKPAQKFFVNAGIYVLNPSVLSEIPKNAPLDMPTLFCKLLAANKKTIAFPIREYWLDIGRMADFERANDEFNGNFK